MGLFEEVRRRLFSLAWIRQHGEQIVLSHEELTLLLGGIDLKQTSRRTWYRKVKAEGPAELRITL